MILDKILAEKKIEVDFRKGQTPIAELKAHLSDASAPLGFARRLQQSERGIPAVIAEIKKASPSKGLIRSNFDPESIAKSYTNAGASAISCLTDEKFFQGSLDYLRMVKNAVPLPVLRKDFMIDEYQVFEARAAGADAILLIVAVLEKDKIAHLMQVSNDLGMDSLIEVHDEREMEIALELDCRLIGINNRNLQTFEVTLVATSRLLPMITSGAKSVSESGIFTREDMVNLGKMGVDAVLIGEALMREDDIEAKLRELIG
ncbi:MAG: indole-3-glycerol phosphate synthase TrpC [Armatimonadetes bacterium]|nr:indole-3-glycerol phosphate synthase TrpC [Armatimonadota bacterium]